MERFGLLLPLSGQQIARAERPPFRHQGGQFLTQGVADNGQLFVAQLRLRVQPRRKQVQRITRPRGPGVRPCRPPTTACSASRMRSLCSSCGAGGLTSCALAACSSRPPARLSLQAHPPRAHWLHNQADSAVGRASQIDARITSIDTSKIGVSSGCGAKTALNRNRILPGACAAAVPMPRKRTALSLPHDSSRLLLLFADTFGVHVIITRSHSHRVSVSREKKAASSD
jgi:hypothetical protein